MDFSGNLKPIEMHWVYAKSHEIEKWGTEKE